MQWTNENNEWTNDFSAQVEENAIGTAQGSIIYFLCVFVNNSILLGGQTRIRNGQTKIMNGQTISVLKLKKMQSELLRSVLTIFYVYLLITRFC